jgi:hypothetical protein
LLAIALVFVDGWDQQAAGAIGGLKPKKAFRLLLSLAEKNLLTVAEDTTTATLGPARQ